MSGLPTLLKKGSLVLEDGSSTSAITPIDYIISWIRKRMPENGSIPATLANRVLVILAETGSGKSTTLPVAVFRLLRSPNNPKEVLYSGPGVICTQPRVLTAMSLTSDIEVNHSPWNHDMIIGQTLGFQTGPISNLPPAGLVYATAGVLAEQLRTQDDLEFMSNYRFILVDEAHERAIDCDMTLMMLRNFYIRNQGNKKLPFLLLTSATFKTGRYAEYFGVGPENIMTVIGATFPINTHYSSTDVNNYPVEAANLATKLHEEFVSDRRGKCDILMFMPGNQEAKAAMETLIVNGEKYSDPSSKIPPFLILNINREVVVSQTSDYSLVFINPAELPLIEGRLPSRRIIVATIVAETGLTIETLKYVIDCGWNRGREVYQPYGAEGIVTRPAPQSRIKQRRGRVGRKFIGEFYPLYTETTHKMLTVQQPADIITSGISYIYLSVVREQQRLKTLGKTKADFRAEDITLLDPPPPESLISSNSNMTSLGFISAYSELPISWPPPLMGDDHNVHPHIGYGLTKMGFVASTFNRTPMEGVRMFMASYVWGSSMNDLIIAAAMFGQPTKGLLIKRGRKKIKSDGDLEPGATALLSAVPKHFMNVIGGKKKFNHIKKASPPNETEAAYFRAKLIISDDFVESILIYGMFEDMLSSATSIQECVDWCESKGLVFDTLIGISRIKDSIIDEVIIAGMNPFRLHDRRISMLPKEEFESGLIAIKKCLYDGLRNNLLTYDPNHEDGPCYVSMQNLAVEVPPILSDAMQDRLNALDVTNNAPRTPPRWIIADKLQLNVSARGKKEKQSPFMYSVNTSLISVMDGYVNCDDTFSDPRGF